MYRYLCQLCETIVSYGDNHPCLCYKNDVKVYSIQDSADNSYARHEEALENISANYETLFPETLNNDIVDTEILEENFLDKNRQFSLSYKKWLKCVSKNSDYESYESLYKNPPYSSLLNDPSNVIYSNDNQNANFRKLSASLDYVYKFQYNNRGASRRKSKSTKIFKELNEEIESDRSSFLPENNSDPTAETHLFDVTVTPEVTAKSSNSSEYLNTNANGPMNSIESSRINLPFNRDSVKGKFVYNICDKEFQIKSEFDFNFQNHTGKKRFRCDVCKKEFFWKKDLKRHYRTHTGEKPFQCDVCKRAFAIKETLRKHCRIHNVEMPFECDVCKKRLITKEKLKNHYIRHTRKKPFVCDKCPKIFAFKSQLARHSKTHEDKKR